ncbi:MAG: metal-dependent hydrolase [Candidatus Heimdallarchaeaceae archaeon]
MQGGVHLLSGLVLASLGKKKDFKVSVTFGAIIPDIDIFIAALAYLFIGEKAVILHRSFTHSMFSISILSLLIYILGLTVKKYFPDKKISKMDFRSISIGISIGMLTHVILDLFYLVKVAIFWPFSFTFIGWPLVTDLQLSVLALKILQTTDFMTDIFFFILPLTIISFKQDKCKYFRKLLIPYIIIDLLFTIIFIFVAFFIPLSYNDFLVYLYYPGTFFLLFSIFSPLIFKEVIKEFKFDNYIIVIIVALFIFSQLLFSLFLL